MLIDLDEQARAILKKNDRGDLQFQRLDFIHSNGIGIQPLSLLVLQLWIMTEHGLSLKCWSKGKRMMA